MMKHFCQVGAVWQGILLVLSLITVNEAMCIMQTLILLSVLNKKDTGP